MRCESCRQITISTLRNNAFIQKPSFPALKLSAELGCDLCNLSIAAITTKYTDRQIIENICRGQDPYYPDSHDTTIVLEGALYDNYVSIRSTEKVDKIMVYVGSNEDRVRRRHLEGWLSVCADPGAPLAKYVHGRLPSQNPSDPSSLSKVGALLKNCDSTHRECAFLAEDRPLPTRILDVKGKVTVAITNGTKGRYVALSYCWGTSRKNVLLSKNKDIGKAQSTFDEFTSAGIDEGKLPATIRDAIHVCRCLGIRYLWVDALCIVQGEPDLKDFKAEAPQMCDYYSNAYFTIIAEAAEDCADGFLSERPIPRALPCEIKYDRTNTASDSPEKGMTGVVNLSLHPLISKNHIGTRAWTFQESVLSQRTVSYDIHLTHMRCPSSYIIEDGRFGKSPKLEGRPTPAQLQFRYLSAISKNCSMAEVEKYAYDIWCGKIIDYTRREMTSSLDKLAAFAGCARLIQQLVSGQYMYGLWEKDLPLALLWAPSHRQSATRAPDRAPSWSWASINGAVGSTSWREGLRTATVRNPSFLEVTPPLFMVLSREPIPTSLDPIRDDLEKPKAFELTVRGLFREVWHLSTSDMKTIIVGSNYTGEDTPEGRLAVGKWDTLEDHEAYMQAKCPLYALLLIQKAGLLVISVDKKYYRRVGIFMEPKTALFEGVVPTSLTLI